MKIPQALCTVPEDFVTDFYMISSYQQEEELYYMEQKKNLVTLGSTGITVEKNSFGALPSSGSPGKQPLDCFAKPMLQV